MVNRTFRWIICGELILLVMPIAVWFSDWSWTPDEDNFLLRPLFWATETASSPWGILTCIVLSLWFIRSVPLSLKRAIALMIVLAIAIIGGQIVKSAIKDAVEEPRPYVLWLEKAYKSNNEQAFYLQPRKARARIIDQYLHGQNLVPPWLVKHWKHETGYSFPSGHTLFTATWALLGMGILLPRRRYFSAAVLMFWAVTVAGSRLLLGMHWPEDLIVSILLSGIFASLACWAAERWVFPSKDENENHTGASFS
ncbi:MAG: phosphatidylglycerophosphatase B [Enterobacteriaceae bacterium]|nr:phosphatidylglycerophosphatase B [Enterobacteriaceae bacterium]